MRLALIGDFGSFPPDPPVCLFNLSGGEEWCCVFQVDLFADVFEFYFRHKCHSHCSGGARQGRRLLSSSTSAALLHPQSTRRGSCACSGFQTRRQIGPPDIRSSIAPPDKGGTGPRGVGGSYQSRSYIVGDASVFYHLAVPCAIVTCRVEPPPHPPRSKHN